MSPMLLLYVADAAAVCRRSCSSMPPRMLLYADAAAPQTSMLQHKTAQCSTTSTEVLMQLINRLVCCFMLYGYAVCTPPRTTYHLE